MKPFLIGALLALGLASVALSSPLVGAPGTDYTSTGAWTSSAAWDISRAGTPLNVGQLATATSFYDAASCDISTGSSQGASGGAHKWYSTGTTSIAGNGGVVYTTFVPNTTSPAPITCPGDGYMHFTERYNMGDGTWHSGQIISQDVGHEGFDQQYGYIEARIRFNSAAKPLVPWGQFWSWARDSVQTTSSYSAFQYWELDMIETYLVSSTDDTQNKSSMHQWPAAVPLAGQVQTHRFQSSPWAAATYDDTFHTYGMLHTVNAYIVYRDRVEIGRFHIVANDMRGPGDILLDVANYYNPTGANTATAYDVMDVAYVQAFACAVGGGFGCQ